MLDEVINDADERMGKTLDSLQQAFSRIRTGRANPNLLDGVTYYTRICIVRGECVWD